MTKQNTRMLVLGAGYAGLLNAIRLSRKTRGKRVSVTLVNETDTFTQRLTLHQYATNEDIPWRSIPDTLRGTRIGFIQARVTALNPDSKVVTVAQGEEEQHLPYDYLVYALGSLTDRARIPGVAEYAYTLAPRGPLSTAALREALPPLHATGGRVVVCGGGATGIETAAQIASVYPRLQVTLLTQGDFGAFLGKGVAKRMRRALDQRRVTIIARTSVAEVKPDSVRAADGRIFQSDLCIWTGGFVAPPLAREAGLLVNEHGQIITDPFLRSLSHPDILAVGDAAWPREEPGAPLRMSAFTATILGAYGADSLAATLRGKTPKPLSFAYVGQGIALGRRTAIGYGKTPNDIPYPPFLTGFLGYLIRAFAVYYFSTVFQREKHWYSAYFWTGKGRYASAKRRAEAQSRIATRPAIHTPLSS